VVTQVIVDENDEAFVNPTKPVGRYYPAEEARGLEREHGWKMKEDPQGRGWRRVVPSPKPREIVEQDIVRELLGAGVIVIACGGGGVPVVAGEGGSLRGVDAVIDKDLASALLATHVDAETFAIATEVERVYLNYGKPDQTELVDVDVDQLRRHQEQGQFPPGSMGPKIEAVVGFLERGGPRAIITSPEALQRALEGHAGTHVSMEHAVGAGAP
jgi:carbamate kinase